MFRNSDFKNINELVVNQPYESGDQIEIWQRRYGNYFEDRKVPPVERIRHKN